MSEVKRYAINELPGYEDEEYSVTESRNGSWVYHEDYMILQQKLGNAENNEIDARCHIAELQQGLDATLEKIAGLEEDRRTNLSIKVSMRSQIDALVAENTLLKDKLSQAIEVADEVWWMLGISGYVENPDGRDQDKLLYKASKIRTYKQEPK